MEPRLILRTSPCVEQFGVSERRDLRSTNQEFRPDASHAQPPLEFVTKPVVAHNSQYLDPPGAERGEVVSHRACSAGCYFGRDYSHSSQTGLAGRLGECGIIATPTIEADVSHHQRSQLGNCGEDFRSGHAAVS